MDNHRPFLTGVDVKSPHYDVVKAANPHVDRTNRLCRLIPSNRQVGSCITPRPRTATPNPGPLRPLRHITAGNCLSNTYLFHVSVRLASASSAPVTPLRPSSDRRKHACLHSVPHLNRRRAARSRLTAYLHCAKDRPAITMSHPPALLRGRSSSGAATAS